MIEPLHLPSHEQQKSYSELRSEFREESLRRLRDKLKPLKIRVWNDTIKQWEEKEVKGLMSDYVRLPDLTMQQIEAQAQFMDALSKCHNDDEIEAVISRSPVIQDFGLDEVPQHLVDRLFSKAEESEVFETMVLPEGEGVDHDAPALPQPIDKYTENEIIEYVDKVIAASKDKL